MSVLLILLLIGFALIGVGKGTISENRRKPRIFGAGCILIGVLLCAGVIYTALVFLPFYLPAAITVNIGIVFSAVLIFCRPVREYVKQQKPVVWAMAKADAQSAEWASKNKLHIFSARQRAALGIWVTVLLIGLIVEMISGSSLPRWTHLIGMFLLVSTLFVFPDRTNEHEPTGELSAGE